MKHSSDKTVNKERERQPHSWDWHIFFPHWRSKYCTIDHAQSLYTVKISLVNSHVKMQLRRRTNSKGRRGEWHTCRKKKLINYVSLTHPKISNDVEMRRHVSISLIKWNWLIARLLGRHTAVGVSSSRWLTGGVDAKWVVVPNTQLLHLAQIMSNWRSMTRVAARPQTKSKLKLSFEFLLKQKERLTVIRKTLNINSFRCVTACNPTSP